MAKIFISYAREDEDAAEKIYDSLVNEGHSVWMDRKKLVPGQEWKMEIEKAIHSSDIFLACLSINSVGKQGYVQKELKSALEVADLMPEGRIYIIPARLDECEVPFKLKNLHWVNYFELGSGESLLRAINSHSNAEKDLETEITEYLIRNSPDAITERFKGVAPTKLSKALLSIAKKEDELISARKRAVRGLEILGKLDAATWKEILPVASTDLFQEWIPKWNEDEDPTILTEEDIRIILESKRLPKSSTGFGQAVRKFIKRGAGYTSTVFLPGKKYPAWEVKYDCVRSVIALDDKDTMQVLISFSTMSYWKARDRIIDYIGKKIDNGNLSLEETKIAIEILKQIVTDGKTEKKTPTMRKARETLQKISGEVDL